jgi:hypothetical protein
MNDVKDMLGRALGGTATPDPDPAADVARGHALLRRRRRTLLSGTAAAALVLVAVPVGINAFGAGATLPAAGPAPATAGRALPAVELVSYTGTQPQGYTVKRVPQGWVIEASDLSALVIAPVGGVVEAAPASADPEAGKVRRLKEQARAQMPAGDPVEGGGSSYTGKLVVLATSTDATPGRDGTKVSVNGQPGYLRSESGGQFLTYRSAARWVDIQAPASLGWSGADVVEFAAGITVSKKAQDSHG